VNPYRSVAIPLSAALVTLAGCYGAGGYSEGGEGTPPASETASAPALATPYRAHGNEPFWGLAIEADSMTFTSPDAGPLAVPLPAAEPIEGGRRYRAEAGGQPFVATILERPCADGMSGMPYPHTVTVTAGGVEYAGCGGDPAALLTGVAWRVESIGGASVNDTIEVTLHFTADGRVAGKASCNSYTAGYRLSGEGLAISEVVMTRMACTPPRIAQEQRFIEVLRAVERFEVDPTGALVLHAADGRSVLARRQ
jgi:heat shock protein HslJ